MAELGQKKQRNYLLDFWKMIFSFYVALAHYAYWGSPVGSVGPTMGYFTFTYDLGEGVPIKGLYTLAIFTFTSGYWLIDHFKKLQRGKMLGRGKDVVLAWKYFAKTYSSYEPVIFFGTMLGIIVPAIVLKAEIVNVFQVMATNMWEILGFNELGFTNWAGTSNILVKLGRGEDIPYGYYPYSLNTLVWYMGQLICFGTGLLVLFMLSEKFTLFVVGPLCWRMAATQNTTMDIMSNDVQQWNFWRLLGPLFIGIYGWYLIDTIKRKGVDAKLKKTLTILHGLSLCAYLFWTLVWGKATLLQGDLIVCCLAFFAILNEDGIAHAANKVFNKISFISKHFATYSLGFFITHGTVRDVLAYYDGKGLIPWFSDASNLNKFLMFMGICAAVGFVIFPANWLIINPLRKFLTNLTGCRKPVVFDDEVPAAK